MSDLVHPLYTDIHPPRQFTYPFCYEPHPLCIAAAKEVQRYIEESGVWKDEKGPGKMFGVLCVREKGKGKSEKSEGEGVDEREHIGFLAAYSGLLAGRNDWGYFVPPVFDAQQPDGHFKTEERAISALNKEIDALQKSDIYLAQRSEYEDAKLHIEQSIEQMRCRVAETKRQRDARRHEAEQGGKPLTAEEKAAMVHESQHLKAEQRRLKQQCTATLDQLRRPLAEHEARVDALRRQRREMSDALQQWLFSQYRMLNANGEERDLVDIFGETINAMPPAGSGDCCAPKLLQYAYANGLEPVCMAEFWWGDSPKQEIRHHLHYYPACRSKCLPILTHMLRGLDVEPNPLAQPKTNDVPRIVYEDDTIIVVDKPAGMLSVPGKAVADGDVALNGNAAHADDDVALDVEEYVRQYLTKNSQLNPQNSQLPTPNSQLPKAVHRLDMDTSGLLVLALTDEAYIELQRQFASREVKKRYEAVLDGKPSVLCGAPGSKWLSVSHDGREGRISLPLIADIMDRPRQRVDFDNGKTALTDYRIERLLPNGGTLVSLYPLTGRTHQLRVHCAHNEGLACPILGDPLYGHGCHTSRMYLHAAMVEFRHPVTGERLRFESASGF
ncbi:MAG: pseudouridine synthase [Prevotella sp.]|uniref:RluA family pseudouridine synthase n=1 Tax=Prevotella sp. TaxID=59823 RepID=UPI0025EAF82D|nr:RluA family pseudouridine synthase [Prevotella sp.]MCI7118943.1 pseudouridine synthase [Prevotella sp.]